jgi:hypothetical protein
MPRVPKLKKRAGAAAVIAGLKKHFAKDKIHLIGSKQYTTEQLVAVFQSQIDATAAVAAANAEMQAAIGRERAIDLHLRDLTRLLKHSMTAAFGLSAKAFADFGWDLPKKPGPKTVKAKVEGAKKALATRKARHTMGKRQRLKIRG